MKGSASGLGSGYTRRRSQNLHPKRHTSLIGPKFARGRACLKISYQARSCYQGTHRCHPFQRPRTLPPTLKEESKTQDLWICQDLWAFYQALKPRSRTTKTYTNTTALGPCRYRLRFTPSFAASTPNLCASGTKGNVASGEERSVLKGTTQHMCIIALRSTPKVRLMLIRPNGTLVRTLQAGQEHMTAEYLRLDAMGRR